MNYINGIANIQVEQNLSSAVKALNTERTKSLLRRFTFNQEVIKELAFTTAFQNLDMAELLLSEAEKNTKEQVLISIRRIDEKLFFKLYERVY